jgi:probable F420-dependent oxidoreductase
VATAGRPKLGIHLPQTGGGVDPNLLRDFAQLAEGLGFDSLWLSDHVVHPRQGDNTHPIGDAHGHLPPERPWLEALETMAYVAALTTRTQIGTAVLVLPQRNPVLTAKQLATIDVLSAGRLILGAGIGWWAEEFEALATPFRDRGRRMDEYLEVIRQCWMEQRPCFEGKYYKLGDVGFYPKPPQCRDGGRPPVWIGAYSSPGFKRAGRAGDGLFLSRTPPDEIPAAFAESQAAAVDAGRDPAKLTLTSFARLRWETDDEVREAVAGLRGLVDAGVQHIVMQFNIPGKPHPLTAPERDPGAALRYVERFWNVVRPGAGF